MKARVIEFRDDHMKNSLHFHNPLGLRTLQEVVLFIPKHLLANAYSRTPSQMLYMICEGESHVAKERYELGAEELIELGRLVC